MLQNAPNGAVVEMSFICSQALSQNKIGTKIYNGVQAKFQSFQSFISEHFDHCYFNTIRGAHLPKSLMHLNC